MELSPMNVSVCIPTYNQAAFVEKSIRSALRQSWPPKEIIVSNDASTDETALILDKLAIEIPLLKVIHQPVNLGITLNTDACLRLASSDFIVRLDSDDLLEEDYIQKLLDLLNHYTDAGYAHASVQEIDEYGHPLRLRKLFRKDVFQTGDEALKASLHGYKVAANILMFRKQALEKVDYLKGRPNFGEDYHLVVSISAAGYGNVYLAEVLSCYRVWVDKGKVRQKRKLDEIAGLRSVFDDVMMPAYINRGWAKNSILKSKTSFACAHADCLGWSVYNEVEKQELKKELALLSSSPRAKFYAWMHLNGFTNIIYTVENIKSFPKKLIKRLIK